MCSIAAIGIGMSVFGAIQSFQSQRQQAKAEKQSEGSRKRMDLTLLGRDDSVVLTGEIKLPYQKDGGSPYNHEVVKDARRKALNASAPYFFTWNVNEFVLWETTSDEPSWQEENYRSTAAPNGGDVGHNTRLR